MTAHKTKLEYVHHQILKKISEENMEPGDKLPSELEFQKMYDVSRHTVRSALNRLENAGIIVKEQGAGSFVAKLKPKRDYKEIGVITTYVSDYIFPLTIRGIEQELTKNGYSMILSSTNNDRDIEEAAIQMMIDRNVDGVIVEPTQSSYYNSNLGLYLKLKNMGIPIIMINARYEGLDFPLIALDDLNAGYEATKNLIENNHTNIGGIFKADDLQGQERHKGFIKACFEYGINYNKENIFFYETDNFNEVISTKVSEMVKSKRVTGVVCYNDTVAIEILKLIWTFGYNVPEDLSIVSHDNSTLSSITEVKINSINHPKTILGRDAAINIIKMVEDPNYEMYSIFYPAKMIEKQSVKKLDIE